MVVRNKDFAGDASGYEAVGDLRQILLEKAKARRLLLVASFLLLITGVVVVVFAPLAHQSLAYAFGALLLGMALGAVGATQF